MNEDTIDFELPSATPEEAPRDCHMSIELFQNARMTMGELRDFMREAGISWDFIRQKIEEAQHAPSPLDRTLRHLDDYSTGIGKSLHDKERNVW